MKENELPTKGDYGRNNRKYSSSKTHNKHTVLIEFYAERGTSCTGSDNSTKTSNKIECNKNSDRHYLDDSN